MKLNESFFDTGEVSLHVMEGPASGPPLVLLHGSTSSWASWGILLPHLLEHWHVYALDQRGHGQSGRAADIAGYHLSAYQRDALAFVRERVRQPAVLYGHSWGAVVATLCGAPGKDLVRGLVLEDPPVLLRRETPVMDPFIEYFAWVKSLLLADPRPETIAATLQQQNPGVPAAALTGWADALAHTDPVYLDALLTRTGVAQGIDFDRAIQDIPCPILLLQADLARGGAMEEIDADLFRQNARRLEVVYFEGVGHGIHDERSTQVLELLDTFAAKQGIF